MSDKILLISYVSLMASTPNGRTMQSLLQGVPAENIALFSSYGIPDAHSCSSCFKLSNRDALKSILSPARVGTVIDPFSEAMQSNAACADSYNKKKKSWKYLLREFVWMLGRWKNKKLKQWMDEQNPSCVVYMYGDSAAMQRFAARVAKKRNIPLVVYSCEDYCFKSYNYIDGKKHSLAFKWYQSMSKRATENLFKVASGLIVNSDRLGEEYTKRYGIQNVSTVMMASQMSYVENADVKPIEEIHIDYLGALGEYRTRALVEIGEALQAIDPSLKLDVYGRVPNERVMCALQSCPGICYRGFVSYQRVQEVIRDSTLLIEAINDDAYVCKDKRFGFSTKYADCFACGTPFLVYAPLAVIETEFAKSHDCAFVATNPGELKEVLRSAIFDKDARKRQLQNARLITKRYFDKEKNVEAVVSMLKKVSQA